MNNQDIYHYDAVLILSKIKVAIDPEGHYAAVSKDPEKTYGIGVKEVPLSAHNWDRIEYPNEFDGFIESMSEIITEKELGPESLGEYLHALFHYSSILKYIQNNQRVFDHPNFENSRLELALQSWIAGIEFDINNLQSVPGLGKKDKLEITKHVEVIKNQINHLNGFNEIGIIKKKRAIKLEAQEQPVSQQDFTTIKSIVESRLSFYKGIFDGTKKQLITTDKDFASLVEQTADFFCKKKRVSEIKEVVLDYNLMTNQMIIVYGFCMIRKDLQNKKYCSYNLDSIFLNEKLVLRFIEKIFPKFNKSSEAESKLNISGHSYSITQLYDSLTKSANSPS